MKTTYLLIFTTCPDFQGNNHLENAYDPYFHQFYWLKKTMNEIKHKLLLINNFNTLDK